MKCPYCGYTESKVVDSRPTENSSIRRRRECLACHRRFTTYEVIDSGQLIVIKKDKKREIFDRSKLTNGILKSCYKRPVTNEQIDRLVSEIESELQNSMRDEVTSKELGEMVMDKLRTLDEVSYVRFASVYRQFKDVETFMEELKNLAAAKNSVSSCQDSDGGKEPSSDTYNISECGNETDQDENSPEGQDN